MQTEEPSTKPAWSDDIPSNQEELPAPDKPAWEDDIPLEAGGAAKIEVDAIGTTAPDDPYEVLTNHSFATHPMSKGVVVLAMTFAALSVGGILFTVLMGGFSSANKNVASNPKEPSTSKQQSITDADTLRAKLLLNEQSKEVSKFKQKKQAKAASTPKPVPVQPTPVVVPPRQAPASSRPTNYSNAPRPALAYSRPTLPLPTSKSNRTIAYSALPQRVAPPPPPRPEPQQSSTDPTAQWLAAGNIGSYGSISVTPRNTATSSRGTRATNYRNVSSETLETGTNLTKSTDTTSSSYQSVNYSNNAGNNVMVGTKAEAKLETPIAWSGNLKNSEQNFLIQLDEPLKASNNTVVVPKGAYLVAKISAADQVGLLNMSVTSVLVNENGRTNEKPVPSGVLLILGKDGQPLKASSQRRNTTGNDLGTIILSGAATTAGLVNRPTSQSVYNGDGGFSSTTTTNDPNYLAGFGEGASQALLQQMQTRNNQARRAAQSEPKVFTLKQGTSVQVFVNKSTSF